MAGKLWCYVSYVVPVKMIDHMITLLDAMEKATDFRRCFVEHRTAVFVEVKFYISPATWQAKLHRTLLKLMFWQSTRSIAGACTTTEQPSVALWSTSSLDLSYLHYSLLNATIMGRFIGTTLPQAVKSQVSDQHNNGALLQHSLTNRGKRSSWLPFL